MSSFTDVVIGNDIHLYSSHEIIGVGNFNSLVAQYLAAKQRIVLAGDIVDLANVARENASKAKDTMDALKRLLASDYINGNHEIWAQSFPYVHVKVGTKRFIIAHGDYEWWGLDKTNDYRMRTVGAGPLKRLILPFFDEFRHQLPLRITSAFESNLKLLTDKIPFDTYICGHKHPTITWQSTCLGRRVVVLPRGIRTVRLQDDGQVAIQPGSTVAGAV